LEGEVKYNNKKTTLDGLKFDSQAEAKRYSALKLLQKAGHISNLQMQVPFELWPGVKFHSAKRATPACRYVADFVYREPAGDLLKTVIEDVKSKGTITAAFKIKRHAMLALHGLHIRLVMA
jgi:hypothetical protein